MPSEQPLVIVDDREPDNAATRMGEFGLMTVVDRLSSGDYCFYPHGQTHRIERKTISNLLESMASKQLVGQAHKMVAESDRAWLLREGPFRREQSGSLAYYNPRHPSADSSGWVLSGWNWDSFEGMMLDLQLLGIGFIDCPILGDYPRTLAWFIANVSKEDHQWLRERGRPDIVTLDKQYRNAIWSICAFDGWGPELAEAALNEYGMVWLVYKTAVQQPELLAKVKVGRSSIGAKRVASLREELLAEWKSPEQMAMVMAAAPTSVSNR